MYKKILLPVDVFEMDLSDKAVRHAEFLASAENGEITLLNVLPNSSRSLLRGFTADIRKFEAYMQEESEKRCARWRDCSTCQCHGSIPGSCLVTCAMKFWLSVTTKRSM